MKHAVSESSEQKQRRVTYETYKRWIVDNDREIQMMMWLGCEMESQHRKSLLQN